MQIKRALAFLSLALPVFAQNTPGQETPYEGPAILTRGQAPAAMAAPRIDFRPFVEVAEVYDTGLSGVSVNDQGQLANQSSFGTEIAGGISGVHSWQHTLVGLDYRGSFRHYNHTTYYDGTDQSLLLGITHQLTKHIQLTSRTSGGISSRNYGLTGLSQTVPYDPTTAYIPTTDFFDNRTFYLTTQADLTYHKSTRLSFNFGGDGFVTRYRSSALYGTTGATARGDVQYRISRRSTIGAQYSYMHFDYVKIFNTTDIHSVVGSYSVRLNRTTEFTGYAGALRFETKFIQNIPLDPVVAALLGQTEGSILAHRIQYIPTYSGRLSRTFPTGVAYISGSQTVTPGNGLFLTSRMTGALVGYSYTGLRRWSFGIDANATFSKSVGNVVGNYNNYSGGFTASRQISGAFHAIASFYVRKYESPDFSGYNRPIYTARLGIGYSPGDIPLRLW